MMKKAMAALLIIISAISLLAVPSWAADELEGWEDQLPNGSPSAAGSAPVITTNPSAASKTVGDGPVALTITAQAPSGEPLEYEWLVSDTPNSSGLHSAPWREGTSGGTYITEEKEGTQYYACMVYNSVTGESALSQFAKVTYAPKQGGETPKEAIQPVLIYGHTLLTLVEGESFSVEATVSNKSKLPSNKFSYQWYEGSSQNPSKISGATGTKLTRTLSSGGTHYYFLEAKYTDPATGAEISSISSEMTRVKVTVEKPAVKEATITQQPSAISAYQGDSLNLTIEAASPDGGSIYCNWFISKDKAYNGVKASTDANPVCIVDTSKVGTIYYYCEVTNFHSETASSIAKSEICTVKITPGENAAVPASIVLSAKGPFKPGETTQLSISGTMYQYPESWTVSNMDLGSIDENGLFSAKADGSVNVIAKLPDGQELTTPITVSDPMAAGFVKPWMWAFPVVISALGITAVIRAFLKSSQAGSLRSQNESSGEEGAYAEEQQA